MSDSFLPRVSFSSEPENNDDDADDPINIKDVYLVRSHSRAN